MSTRTFTLSDALYEYVVSVSLRDTDLLQRLRKETASLPRAHMQIAPEQGQLMALLVRPDRRETLPRSRRFHRLQHALHGVRAAARGAHHRLRRERGVDRDRATLLARSGRRRSHRPSSRTRHRDPGSACSPRSEAGAFDFAFIDADKVNYLNYYERALTLVRSGGLVAIDNTLWYGRVADPSDHDEDTEAIRAFNARLRNDERIDLSLVPIGDGMTLARKR